MPPFSSRRTSVLVVKSSRKVASEGEKHNIETGRPGGLTTCEGVPVWFGQVRLVRHFAEFHEVLERLHGPNLRYLLALIGVFCLFDSSVLCLFDSSVLRPSLESVGLWRESFIHEA